MTKNKVQTKVISEAPESNAGDDFHILWAARKSLELLKLGKTNLKRITVEGPDPKEGNAIDVTGVKLLSIDLGEYYGGDSLKDSDKVVFSQLKYSTRRSNLKYTLARICEGEKPILQRLATTFSGYLNKYGRELVLQKLTLKLVSNRFEIKKPL